MYAGGCICAEGFSGWFLIWFSAEELSVASEVRPCLRATHIAASFTLLFEARPWPFDMLCSDIYSTIDAFRDEEGCYCLLQIPIFGAMTLPSVNVR